ncbi:MAG TPA: hypothetical protein VK466_07470, partial [Terriglobales bacterium]|nr:hypothetical protein [Terriglobales bacterium]
MKLIPGTFLACCLLLIVPGAAHRTSARDGRPEASLFGYRDASPEIRAEERFLAVPDPKLAEEHLRILTQAPHIAGSPEDKATADYVAQKFREAGF